MSSSSLDQICAICEEQEDLLQFTEFSGETAWKLGNIIRNKFLANPEYSKDRDIVIQIKLITGHVLFTAAVETHSPPLTGPDNWDWVRCKENVVRRFGKSSFYYYKNCLRMGKPFGNDRLDAKDYIQSGGAFPIKIKGVSCGPIGTIIVSGMPDYHDHQIIADSIGEYLGLSGIKSVA